jgi:hypothetical protein
MTLLVWIVLALLLAGFAIRLGLASYRRIGEAQAS